MLVSPAEPADLREVGTVSSRPERYGVDFMFVHDRAWFGVQRKELSDLVNSVRDGRLTRELGQMAGLARAVLLVEGAGVWTNDGELVGYGRWSRAAHRGLLWSVRARGVWVDQTGSKAETREWLAQYETWVRKAKHSGTFVRPGPVTSWGPGYRDWQIHFLCGIDGIGPDLARKILDTVGMPFRLAVTAEKLRQIPGLGPERVRKIVNVTGE